MDEKQKRASIAMCLSLFVTGIVFYFFVNPIFDLVNALLGTALGIGTKIIMAIFVFFVGVGFCVPILENNAVRKNNLAAIEDKKPAVTDPTPEKEPITKQEEIRTQKVSSQKKLNPFPPVIIIILLICGVAVLYGYMYSINSDNGSSNMEINKKNTADYSESCKDIKQEFMKKITDPDTQSVDCSLVEPDICECILISGNKTATISGNLTSGNITTRTN